MAFTPFSGNIPPETITDQIEKTTPVVTDELLIADSQDSYSSKKIQLNNIPESDNRFYTERAPFAFLDGLSRKEGKFYYATDQQRAYVDNGIKLIPISTEGYSDVNQLIVPLNDGVTFQFASVNTSYAAGSFSCYGFAYPALGFIPPFVPTTAQSLYCEIEVLEYNQLEGTPYVTFTISNNAFSQVVLSAPIAVNSNGNFNYTFSPAELSTLSDIGFVIIEFHTNGVVIDTITNPSTTWLLDSFKVQQNSIDYINENFSLIPTYWLGNDFLGQPWSVTSISSPYNVTSDDNGVIFDVSTITNAPELNLPEISTLSLPFNIAIKKSQDNVNSNTITINASGSDTFNSNGSSSITIETTGSGLQLIADDNNAWYALPFNVDTTPVIPTNTMQIDDGGQPQVDELNRYYIKTVAQYSDLPINMENERGSFYHTLTDDRTWVAVNQPWWSINKKAMVFTETYPPTSQQVQQTNGFNFTNFAANLAQAETKKAASQISLYGLVAITNAAPNSIENKIYCTNVTNDSTYWTMLNVDSQTVTINLSASTTAVIPDWTFAHANHKSMAIDYSLVTSNNDVATGTLRIATNGTLVNITNEDVQVGTTGVTFTAAVNGANIEISYVNATANTATIESDYKLY